MRPQSPGGQSYFRHLYTPNIFILNLSNQTWRLMNRRSESIHIPTELFLAKVYSHSPQMMTEMRDWWISVRQDRWRWSEGAYSKWFDLQCSLPYAQVLLGHIFHIAIATWLQTERADASIPVDLFVNFLESIEILYDFMTFYEIWMSRMSTRKDCDTHGAWPGLCLAEVNLLISLTLCLQRLFSLCIQWLHISNVFLEVVIPALFR